MSKVTVFETLYENAAGIDIGAEEIFVSIDGKEVVSFLTFTADYYKCAEYLQEHKITRVAMEATGVYWMALYAMLESCGIKVSLVNPNETKQVKGRKTDVKDCRWIQKLFSAGILRESFVPEGKLMELRHLVRDRLDIIEMGSTYVNKMQKFLELMNIKLKEVISQIHGVSGIKMIKAILNNQRDPSYLLSLCDERIIRTKSERILKALEGNYNDSFLFLLQLNLGLWEEHQLRIATIDKAIEGLLLELSKGKPMVTSEARIKSIKHHPPKIDNLHTKMLQIYGVNMSTISGINNYTLLRLLGETGVDMSRFPTVKHFISWCGLAPKNHQSGKMNKRVKGSKCNNTGQIFKECAQGLLNSNRIAIGIFMKRLRSRKDSGIAIKAGARKIAMAYYNSLTKGTEYIEQGMEKYKEQLKQKEIALAYKLARKHNLLMANNQVAA